MKKKSRSLYYIILMVFLQVFGGFTSAMAITEVQKNEISEHCEIIRDNLKNVQINDSRMRSQLGRYYDVILAKFIMPLNLRLVENNLPKAKLTENQSDFNKVQAEFKNEYIEYQKGLEELVAMDCKAEPARFYERLEWVRVERAMVAKKVGKLRKIALEQVSLVKTLKEGLTGTSGVKL